MPGHRHPDLQRVRSAAASRSTASALKEAIRARLRARDARVPVALLGRAPDHARATSRPRPGRGVPVIHIDFSRGRERLVIEMIPKGSRLGEQLLAAHGDPRRGRRRDQDLRRRLRARGGRQDLPADHRRRGRRRHRGPVRAPRQGRGDASARLALRGSGRREARGARSREAVNMLGVGPQGLGGDSTAFAVHVETAATHITMNPVAVNMQCHSARRARATFRPVGGGIRFLGCCSVAARSSGCMRAELEGVNLEDRVRVDGQELQLNGLALRTRFIFKVYVAGLYLPAKATTAQARDRRQGTEAHHPRDDARRERGAVRRVDRRRACARTTARRRSRR